MQKLLEGAHLQLRLHELELEKPGLSDRKKLELEGKIEATKNSIVILKKGL